MVCFAFIVVIVCVLGRMEKIEIWKSEWEGACCYIWQNIYVLPLDIRDLR